MKIHRVVQMLGLTQESGRLASDMYDLNNKTYYSEAEGNYLKTHTSPRSSGYQLLYSHIHKCDRKFYLLRLLTFLT